jgi:hypothetical protein
MKKILADLEFILRSPMKIEDASLEIEITNDGNALIQQIIVTMQIVCSNLLLSPTTEPKNGKNCSAYFQWPAEYLPDQ